MSQLSVPFPIVCEDYYLPLVELFLEQFGNHPAVIPIKTDNDIVKEKRVVFIRLAFCHRQKNAKTKAVPISLRECQSGRVLFDVMEYQTNVDCLFCVLRHVELYAPNCLVWMQNLPHPFDVL